jgi:hypothetical protein
LFGFEGCRVHLPVGYNELLTNLCIHFALPAYRSALS